MQQIWKKKKEILKQKFSGITDRELIYSEGKESVMLKNLMHKSGKTVKEILRIIIDS